MPGLEGGAPNFGRWTSRVRGAPEVLGHVPVSCLAEEIAENSEFGIWMTKRGLWANLDAPSLRHAIELENRTQVLGTFTGNMAEAMVAFQQKRPPTWGPF